MTTITVELPADLDDCDRSTVLGIISRALAADDKLADHLLFRGVAAFDVIDHEPRQYSDAQHVTNRVHVGQPAQIEYVGAS